MLTISITFAVLVALWGFSGAIASVAKRRIARPVPRPARTAPRRPVTSRPRASRPITSA